MPFGDPLDKVGDLYEVAPDGGVRCKSCGLSGASREAIHHFIGDEYGWGCYGRYRRLGEKRP